MAEPWVSVDDVATHLGVEHVQPYSGSGIETEEQLDAALAGLRDECSRLIGAGKKVVLS